VVQSAGETQGDDAGLVDAVAADAVVGVGAVCWVGFGAGGVGDRWGGVVGQGAVWAAVVVGPCGKVERLRNPVATDQRRPKSTERHAISYADVLRHAMRMSWNQTLSARHRSKALSGAPRGVPFPFRTPTRTPTHTRPSLSTGVCEAEACGQTVDRRAGRVVAGVAVNVAGDRDGGES
jgi:hypothetical protein